MKPFTKIVLAVFSLVALLHLLRLVFSWELQYFRLRWEIEVKSAETLLVS
ncbi:MAG: hypothetical protein QMD07_04310 [Thermodesulfovibrionales bacterium]|nr:hypothetical protein [Thermodesulfovibrionales bacterium]